MGYIHVVGLCFGFLSLAQAQLYTIGCPAGWFLNSDRCYKFEENQPLVWEEADAACTSYGASLASINTGNEHSFISKWLITNSLVRQSYWLTSGYYYNRIVMWEGEDTIHYGPYFWIRQPTTNDTVYRIAYTYAGTLYNGFAWTNVSASVPANYICEISREAARSLNILQRDFGYGQSLNDPTLVKRGPKVIKQPENTVILDGALPLEIDCFATGYPYPTFSWWAGQRFSNGTQITSALNDRFTLSGGQFSIQGPTREDVGQYYCQVENEVGSVYSNQVNLIYGYLEHFSNVVPEPVYATAFKGAKMECNPPAYSPAVTYEWFRDETSNMFIYKNDMNLFVSRSGALYISEVQPTDADRKYVCTVTLIPSEGMVFSRAFAPSRTSLGLLLLLNSDSASNNDYGPIINIHAFPTPALVGRTIYLECIAYGTHPLYYSWHRENGQPFVNGTSISVLNRRLTITNAPLEAEGIYICTCSRGGGTVATKRVAVYMEAKPYFPYPIKNIFADPGMRVDWHCKAVARPAATYAWYKNGKLLQTVPGQMEVKGHVLTILSVDKSRDEGMYQCGATNIHGTSFSSGQLTVLSFKPNFNRRPLYPLTLAPLGGNITIPCGVEAAPLPDVRWLKNGGDLNLNPGDVSGRLGMDTQYGLVMTDISFSDQGVYTCQASNTLGEASNFTSVKVTEGVMIITPPTPTTVRVNQTAFMFCQASYDWNNYDLVYAWKFNGRYINYQLNPEYVPGHSQDLNGLYITSAQYKHQGVYECVARTTLNIASRSAYLSVKGPPGPPAGVYAEDATKTNHSVRLIWTVGQGTDHGSPIIGYDIEAEAHYYPGTWKVMASDIPEYVATTQATQQNYRTDQRSVVVTGLIPHTSYRFRIRAYNEYGRGKEASRPSKAVKIPQTAPTLIPRHVGGGGGKVGTLTVKWEPLDISEHCGPGLGYNVYWKKEGDQRDWKYENVTNPALVARGMFVATIGDDNYYLRYVVKVGAYNVEGSGPNSSEVVIYSAEGMPISVPTLKDVDGINGTSIMVNWVPVPDDREHMKGRVAGYRVHFYENRFGISPFDGGEPDPVFNDIKFKDVYGQTDHAQLIGLTANAEFFCRAQVFNTAGAGPKGEWRRGETNNTPLRRFPTHVEVRAHDSHSVKVRWRGVSINPDEESLQGYIIRVWKVQEDIRTAKDTKVEKVQEAVVGGLQRHVVYEMRVLGYSRAGDGALSEAVFFTIRDTSVYSMSVTIDPTVSDICYSYASDESTCGGMAISCNKIVLLVLILAHIIARVKS